MAQGRLSRATIYQRLDAGLEELRSRLGGLPSPKESEFIWSDIWHLEAHHSTAIEGNTLVLSEVEKLLEQGRAVGAKPLKEYMEVRGYGDAAKWVYAQAREPGDWSGDGLMTVQTVRHVHHATMNPVWQVEPHPHATDREAPGNWREHDIQPFDGGMRPPDWPLVPARIAVWIDDVNGSAARLVQGEVEEPLPELLARLHNDFECIHPFIDGNGRTGRLLLNLMLVRLGFPPVIVLKQQRERYLWAMGKADQGDHGPLGEILARAMTENLNRFIIPGVAGPARLVPLEALAGETFSVAALRQAAQRGRLDATHANDGTWRSSQRAVEEYACNKGKWRKRSSS